MKANLTEKVIHKIFMHSITPTRIWRGKSHPSNKELNKIIKIIYKLKLFFVNYSDYEGAAQTRDLEKTIIELRKRHPEELPNEIFCMNVTLKEMKNWKSPAIVKSMRLGNVSYKTNSTKTLKGYKPMFVILK